jgi:hypothetical protein
MIDTENPSIEFTAEARCDRCGAQAYCSAERDGTELLFCNHHISEHRARLDDSGWTLTFDYAGLEKIAPGYQTV